MKTIYDLLDEASKQLNTKSDRALAKHVGMSQQNISAIRTRRTLPSDEYIVRLAIAANWPSDLALLYLNYWRCLSNNFETAAQIYLQLIRQREAKTES